MFTGIRKICCTITALEGEAYCRQGRIKSTAGYGGLHLQKSTVSGGMNETITLELFLK